MSKQESGLATAFRSAGLVEKYSGVVGPPEQTDAVGLDERGVVTAGNLDKQNQPCRANNQVTPEYDNSAGSLDLHGQPPPNFVVQKETPEHRFLLYLFAQGNSTIEVFKQLGGEVDPITNLPIPGTGRWSYHWLCQIRRQAWFRQRLTQFLHETGKDVVQAKLQTELMPSIETVITIRDNYDAPSSVRLAAANSLIDRFLGKPVQHVKSETVHSVTKYEDDAEVIQKQLDQIDVEMRAINAATTPLLPKPQEQQ